MNRARDELLARSRFADNQHSRIAPGDLGHSRQHGGQRRGGADNLFEHRSFVDLFSQRHVFLLQPLLSLAQCLCEALLSFFDVEVDPDPVEQRTVVPSKRLHPTEAPAVIAVSVTNAKTHLTITARAETL